MSTGAKPKMVQFNFRLEEEMKAAGEESATADQRDLTSLLRKLLLDHLKAEGRWPPPKRRAPERKQDKGKR